MLKVAALALTLSAAVLMSGCVVAPLPPRAVRVQPVVVEPAYAPPPGVVYVQPTYAVPAPGYVWRYHANLGWGWRHPSYGWHKGWNGGWR